MAKLTASEKRKKIENRVLTAMSIADKTKKNYNRYKAMFEAMNDKDFSGFMDDIVKGDYQLYYQSPNMNNNPMVMSDLIAAAEYLNLKLMHHLIIHDKATDKEFITPEEYLVIKAPVRRAQQYFNKKISVPKSDTKVDFMSGQVTGESRAANMSTPEILILNQRGLKETAKELVKVRGGDLTAYNEFERTCVETGSVSLDALDPNSKSVSADTLKILLKGIMIDSNI